ncbi:18998_t:CDS:2 [Funneliformis geosporum]|uniref:15023_t:CDS:1 n=1 Tax=Funneliformis geosporum TaxID=1117311 RepID=A0A9W4WUC3_9GLOM|nr:18998_t:CDS:2 [Funneliformis geosporum]CAI2172777.1 15023_t:CDS:2 [Funneliformis geosporum]
MNEKASEKVSKTVEDSATQRRWEKGKSQGNIYNIRPLSTDSHKQKLGRALSFVDCPCQASCQESVTRESQDVSHNGAESWEEANYEVGNKKVLTSTHDKSYIYSTRQQDKGIHGRSLSSLNTSQTANINEVDDFKNGRETSKVEIQEYEDISTGESCSNRARNVKMQTSLGKLLRIGAVGGVEGTKWTSCRFVQPYYRIGKDGSQKPMSNMSEGGTHIESHRHFNNSPVVIEIIANESRRRQIADSLGHEPCEVLNLTKCMDAKSEFSTYFDEVQTFGFNHIILIGERYCGITFLDCYGRVFELDRMSCVLWPLGSSLEDMETNSWTGELAWDVDIDDGIIFELEYCMCTNL